MFGFVLVVELLTAFGNGAAVVGGVAVRVPLLLLALIGDVVALVVVSLASNAREDHEPRDGTAGRVIRYECAHCGWAPKASTNEQAQHLAQQHLSEAHGGPSPTA